MKIRWQGKDYDAVASPTVGEITYLERAIGLHMDEWSPMVGNVAMVVWSVRRADPSAITWEQAAELTVDQLGDLIVVEPGDDDAAAEREGGDPLAGGSPAKNGSSGTRRGKPAAAARTRSAARTTSSTSRSTSA